MSAEEKPVAVADASSSDPASEEQNGFSAQDEKKLLRRQDARIIPLCAAIYFLCFLDRANMGNAKILNSSTGDDMQHALGITDRQFVLALMVFLVAYAAFEVPSNMLLKRLRPSRWLAVLMFGWGALTVSLAASRDFAAVAALRFLLGVFEAGLFPGLVYYLTFWYRHDERSVRVAFILASATLAGAFGGAIAYGIGHINNVHGLNGWRWLFIIEGIPSCISAFLVLTWLPDYPETANWLSNREKALATRRLLHEGSHASQPTMSWSDARATLTDWRLYVHYALYFCISPAFSSLSLFAPSITAGLGYHDLDAQLMTVPPWVVAYVCQITVAYSADRYNARGIHTAGAALVGAIGFVISAALPPTAYAERYGGLIIATSGAFSCIPPLLGWLSSNVFSTAATGLAIALNVSIGGGLGQIPGVWIYKPGEAIHGFPTGHWTNAGFLFLVAILSLGLHAFYRRENSRIRVEAQEHDFQPRLYKL